MRRAAGRRPRLAAAGMVALVVGGCSEPLGPEPEPTPSARLVVVVASGRVAQGDVVYVDVTWVGHDGQTRPVPEPSLSVDDPSIAVVDGSGRLRAVATGTTTVRASAEGASGSTSVQVSADAARFALARYQGRALPVRIAADSVVWNGRIEYHEVYATSGDLELSGSGRPAYRLTIRYDEYDVRVVDGQRLETPRLFWREVDHGLITFDAAGDLGLTSELIAPLHHWAVPVRDGIRLDYRIPGTDDRLDLLFRR